MWDTLEVTHEGTNDVKRARKHALIQEYEMFRMLKGDSIAEVQKGFTHIINHLMSLGKTFDKEKLNIKILKCLDRSWQPKVTAISESKDLTSLTTNSLFGHIKVDCPNKESNEKKSSHKEKKGKSRRAYIAWDENEVFSSSGDEKANICLIAKGDDESCSSSDVSSCASLSAENYSKLLEAFQETHEEANLLVLSNNCLKRLNNWLEKRVKTLEEELEKSKIDLEKLENHCKNSSHMCDSLVCENLEKKISIMKGS
ncbi:uncharacterized protein [Phaseolus vulgaris]|uniref:uncharacterized protein n=1 Tax=Phaseolus vulgaris TaxID=3885 RepID=UPI0035C94EF2